MAICVSCKKKDNPVEAKEVTFFEGICLRCAEDIQKSNLHFHRFAVRPPDNVKGWTIGRPVSRDPLLIGNAILVFKEENDARKVLGLLEQDGIVPKGSAVLLEEWVIKTFEFAMATGLRLESFRKLGRGWSHRMRQRWQKVPTNIIVDGG